MILDVSDKFAINLIICIATSDFHFGEHNHLTLAANKIISYDFPKDLIVDMDDLVNIIKAFKNKKWHYAEVFMRNFARKDPDRFKLLAQDQARPLKYRNYKLKDQLSNKILDIARTHDIRYEEVDVKDLI